MSGLYESFRRSGSGMSVPILARYPAAADPNRLPPQNLEAERSLLGSILLDEAGVVMAEVLDLIDVPDFYRDVHQIVFQGMKDLFEDGKPIDPVTLADMLIQQQVFEAVGGDELLTELVNAVPHAANARFYAGIIKEHSDRRRTIDALTEAMRRAYANEMTAPELLDFVAAEVQTIKVDDSSREEGELHPLPDRMGEKAFHGLAGEIVKIAAPQTEACREAILGQLLVAIGNAIGPRPHWRVDATVHRCNLFLCLVGPTGIARKGTSWDVAQWMLARCDPDWADRPILSGLTSGEGLIDQVRENDGPVLAVESEFARVLTNASRDYSSLSSVLRQAWDGRRLYVATKNNPLFVDNAYFSLIGHMTVSDLKAKLTSNDLENGMANRFLWMSVYRGGELPEGGDFDEVERALGPLIKPVTEAIDLAKFEKSFDRPVGKTARAKEYWKALYTGPLKQVKTGHYAKVTVRAAPLILRIALIYAVLDRCKQIDVPHLEAAKAFWDYCDATCAHLFGDPKKDDELAKVMEALKKNPAGLTKGEICRKAFHGKMRAAKLDELLAQAQGTGQVVRGIRQTGGGPKAIWVYRKPEKG